MAINLHQAKAAWKTEKNTEEHLSLAEFKSGSWYKTYKILSTRCLEQ